MNKKKKKKRSQFWSFDSGVWFYGNDYICSKYTNIVFKAEEGLEEGLEFSNSDRLVMRKCYAK